jgi:chromosome partitioning protein
VSPTVIAVANSKGGVGKSTTTMNLAHELSSMGRRVLTVDLDPGATATLCAGLPTNLPAEQTTQAVLNPDRHQPDWNAISQPAPWGGVMWPGSHSLSHTEQELTAMPAGSTKRLARALREYAGDYDLVLIDTGPNMGKLMINALVAARWAVIPTQCEFAALNGVGTSLEDVREIAQIEELDLDVLGVVPVMYDRRIKDQQETVQALRDGLGDLVFNTEVPLDRWLPRAQAGHQTIGQFRRLSPAARAYYTLAREMLSRMATSQTLAQAA